MRGREKFIEIFFELVEIVDVFLFFRGFELFLVLLIGGFVAVVDFGELSLAIVFGLNVGV
jgi:hypothetical protein